MFDILLNNNFIIKVAEKMPSALVEKYDKKQFYLPDEVKSVFLEELEGEHNIEYAYAMFCTQADFISLAEKLSIESTFSGLRLDVSKKCFDSWPRFNFDSLLEYSQRSVMIGVGKEIIGYGCDFGGGE